MARALSTPRSGDDVDDDGDDDDDDYDYDAKDDDADGGDGDDTHDHLDFDVYAVDPGLRSARLRAQCLQSFAASTASHVKSTHDGVNVRSFGVTSMQSRTPHNVHIRNEPAVQNTWVKEPLLDCDDLDVRITSADYKLLWGPPYSSARIWLELEGPISFPSLLWYFVRGLCCRIPWRLVGQTEISLYESVRSRQSSCEKLRVGASPCETAHRLY